MRCAALLWAAVTNRFITHKDGTLLQDSTRDRYALLFASRQAQTTLADLGIVALGLARNEGVQLGGFRGVFDLRLRGSVGVLGERSVTNVVADVGVEQHGTGGRSERKKKTRKKIRSATTGRQPAPSHTALPRIAPSTFLRVRARVRVRVRVRARMHACARVYTDSCGTMAISCRRLRWVTCAMSCPSMRMRPEVTS